MPSDAAANTTSPAAQRSRERPRTRCAAGTAPAASTRLYEISTQATSVMLTPKRDTMSGSANVTTDESARARATARPSSPERPARGTDTLYGLTARGLRRRSSGGLGADHQMPRTRPRRGYDIERGGGVVGGLRLAQSEVALKAA